MPKFMEHNNWNIMAAIDTETTGLDPNIHEIWNLAIVPLDSNFRPFKEIMPFEVLIKPSSIDNIDWTVPVMKNNRTRIAQAYNEGIHPQAAIEMFERWYKRLGLKETKRIMPLGHNYAFDKAFIQNWIGGPDLYGFHFHHHYRDTMIAAHYINDRLACRGLSAAFPKQFLQYLCSVLHVENDNAHTAMSDALATAEVYRLMQYTFLR